MHLENEVLVNIKTKAVELDSLIKETRHLKKIYKENTIRNLNESIKINQSKFETEEINLLRLKDYYSNVISNEITSLEESFGNYLLPFDNNKWNSFLPVNETVNLIRAGTRLENDIEIPFVNNFVKSKNIVFKASKDNRNEMLQVLQATILRYLTNLPAGKLDLTLIDPINFGQSMACFTSLKELSPEIINGKIFVDGSEIDKQIIAISSEIENRIQNRLSSKYETIHIYNKEAGDLSDNYKLLVLIDFPAKMSSNTLDRLVSIATHGPRCGVYTFILQDIELEFQNKFDFLLIENTANIISMNNNVFKYNDTNFKPEQPPINNVFNGILDAIADGVKKSNKPLLFKEVFDEETDLWTGDSSENIEVPIGRYGNGKEQYFMIDSKGTQVHTLIAGMTGSGKTSLLNTIIMSLVLKYSPEELELYLIDFKNGTGFQTYDKYNLPHAKVIALKTDREFGLSVLENLEKEINERMEIFKKVGCENLHEYKKSREKAGLANKCKNLPRALLIVDEFHELLAGSDNITSNIQRILTLIIKQGRSVGVHCMLATQTLDKANLSGDLRSQCAIRIALQCEDKDSRLILSDNNPEAKLLRKKGETIYNNASGNKENNNKFMFAYLDNSSKEQYLKRVQEIGENNNYRKPVVFDGDTSPEIKLKGNIFIENFNNKGKSNKITAYLGQPLKIKEPITANFFNERGRNLIVSGKGKDETSIPKMIRTAVTTLASNFKQGEVNFCYVDFTNNLDISLVEPLIKIGIDINEFNSKDYTFGINSLASYVKGQLEQEDYSGTKMFLVIAGFHRIRDLRSEEFSSLLLKRDSESEINVAKDLLYILKEGPTVGVHTIIWTDVISILNKNILSEFAMRVAFPMKDSDSSFFIGSNEAAKLDVSRSLYYDDENIGEIDKFIPYTEPSDELLRFIKSKM